jgi:ornithine cyclodeaminase/alanine dehydrogenase-like protein (mu-crystallin family)
VIEHYQILSLGALAAGDVEGRTAAGQITIADLCGIGVQDAAVAAEVMRRAAGAGLGRTLEL